MTGLEFPGQRQVEELLDSGYLAKGFVTRFINQFEARRREAWRFAGQVAGGYVCHFPLD